MKSRKTTINVLFISELPSDIREIEKYLSQSGHLFYRVEYCPAFSDAVAFLTEDTADIDVILVDFGLLVSEQSRSALRQMVEHAGDIPLIVFTEREDHAAALMAIEEGASYNITKGHQPNDIARFRDAIDFSLARAALAGARGDAKSPYEERASTAVIADQKNAATLDARLAETIVERDDAPFGMAVSEISAALLKSRFENFVLLERLREYEKLFDRGQKAGGNETEVIGFPAPEAKIETRPRG